MAIEYSKKSVDRQGFGGGAAVWLYAIVRKNPFTCSMKILHRSNLVLCFFGGLFGNACRNVYTLFLEFFSHVFSLSKGAFVKHPKISGIITLAITMLWYLWLCKTALFGAIGVAVIIASLGMALVTVMVAVALLVLIGTAVFGAH